MSDNDRYKYDPSLAAAAIFVACFSLSGIYHAIQLIKLKSWYFIPFFIGCLVEAIGYAARALNASQDSGQWTKGPYIIQALLLLLGPPFYAASIYMVLGRLIRLLDAEKYSMVRLKWLTKVFLLGDIVSILGQGAGGGMLASADSKKSRDRGQIIIIGGLVIQIIFFSFFMVVTMVFHSRIRREPTKASSSMTSPWEKLLKILYGSSFLILVRSLFRVIEYIMGEDGELMAKEAYIYIFDATLMFLVSVAFNIFHPSAIINKKNKRHARIPSSDVEMNALAYTR
ncbi:RTA1 like protein-domain-containing protein [Dactylonectria estremocensis]|uniref:RTA1 like protein-domain-containing protein n=1 Tax=Dactylonectria estremocensis TaxID=1079267 RepID=A0A9P9IJJ1_9HYPO|nr:RTA1 like protein-domain-containing protein [Dactylonectria estremocensis]